MISFTLRDEETKLGNITMKPNGSMKAKLQGYVFFRMTSFTVLVEFLFLIKTKQFSEHVTCILNKNYSRSLQN